MPRTADSIEEAKAAVSNPQPTKVSGRGKHPNSLAALRPYKPGAEWKGNKEGGRKHDRAGAICRSIIEENEEAIYYGLGSQLARGNAYAFKEVADRAYGKVADKLEVGPTDNLAALLTQARLRSKNGNGNGKP